MSPSSLIVSMDGTQRDMHSSPSPSPSSSPRQALSGQPLESDSFLQTKSTEAEKKDGGSNDSTLHLPPETLKGFTTIQIGLFTLHGLVMFATFCVLVWGAIQLMVISFDSRLGVEEDCTGQNVQTLEKSFYINIRIAERLSFVEAKFLDLAWDTVLGQGGRFLHGWILYHIIARWITWVLEYSSVPFYFQVDMLFSSASWVSIWSSLRFLFSKQPKRTLLAGAWLLLATIYVLSFATIWASTTGYLSPGTPSYRISDGSVLTFDSAELRVCWLVDPSKPNGPNSDVVLGPSAKYAFSSLSDMAGAGNVNNTIYKNVSITSEEFRNYSAGASLSHPL
jgi:hypothetical protein